jgi:galactose mutarotase-like enzyme
MSQIVLACGPDRAYISLMGAELVQWRVNGRALIWQVEAQFWDRTAPVLFPLCGWTRDGVRVKGKHYSLGLHGFAHQRQFSCVEQTQNTAHLILRDDAISRALYPFGFELSVIYHLREGGLDVRFNVRNRDQTLLPYAIGFHPGFALSSDPSREAYFRFAGQNGREVKPYVPIIAAGGLFAPEQRAVDMKEGQLTLSPALWAHEALCFLDVPTHEYHVQLGDVGLDISTHHFPHCVLWSRPHAPFVCVESWTGYGDPVGFDGDLFAKPSMIHLPAEAVGEHFVSYNVRE